MRTALLLALPVVFGSCTPAPMQPEKLADPLPAAACRVAWEKAEIPATAYAEETFTVLIGVRNQSPIVWPDPQLAHPAEGTGRHAVRLSYRWLDADRRPVTSFTGRADLPFPLVPNQSVELLMVVEAPENPGRYRLQFDFVQELVGWFEDKGGKRLTTREVLVRPARLPIHRESGSMTGIR